MVIAVGGCDNVEWGGFDIAIVPPPQQAEDTTPPEPVRALPDGPVLFYVHRDDEAATVIPVAQVTDNDLTRIAPGDDFDTFGAHFIDAFLAPGTELALFRRGHRAGTLTIDSAAVPTDPVCRPLPRAIGRTQLDADTAAVTEFLALSRTIAPASQPADELEPSRSMEVVGDMMAGEMLRARQIPVADAGAMRTQLRPFPLADNADPGFAATYLVDDSLRLGGDDEGAALFVVFTPLGQTGYDTAFVGFTDYTAGGKAAPRVIDFLDWDGDGSVELLLEVFGSHTSWFRAVGLVDGQWRGVFQDRCDPRTAPAVLDTLAAPADDEAAPEEPTPTQTRPVPSPEEAAPDLDSIPDIMPTIQLSEPGESPRLRRDTASRDTVPPDSGGASGDR